MSIEQEFRLAYGGGHSAGIERDRTLFTAGWHAAIRWERSSLHTCSDVCDRPMCVKNRRIDALESRLVAINELTTACECVPCMRIRAEVKAAMGGKE